MSGAISDFSISGELRVTALPCGFSGVIASPVFSGPKITTASGAVTATVYRTILSVTGAGNLKALLVQSTNATSKTMSIRITRDGVVLPAYTTATVAATSGFVLIGGYSSALMPDEFIFDRSLLIEYTSSASETDGANISYNYDLRG